jgi:hypothetical protein
MNGTPFEPSILDVIYSMILKIESDTYKKPYKIELCEHDYYELLKESPIEIKEDEFYLFGVLIVKNESQGVGSYGVVM